MIECQDLFVGYKWNQEPVLKGLNGNFEGKFLILGPNGAGKTTLFRAICGLTNIKSGIITINGKNVKDLYAESGILSTNFQEVYTLLPINVYELIKLYTNLSNGDAIRAFHIIEDLGIHQDFLAKQKLNELSGGQLKIVCTALALSMGAGHILLDEPFENLDPAKKGRMIKHLEEYKGTVLVNTHETWLLKNLQEWMVFFMFEGLLYGPLSVEDLLGAEISFVEKQNALLNIKVSSKTISILHGEGTGTLLTSLENLDKIYDFAGGD